MEKVQFGSLGTLYQFCIKLFDGFRLVGKCAGLDVRNSGRPRGPDPGEKMELGAEWLVSGNMDFAIDCLPLGICCLLWPFLVDHMVVCNQLGYGLVGWPAVQERTKRQLATLMRRHCELKCD